jgi:hypothetical protein
MPALSFARFHDVRVVKVIACDFACKFRCFISQIIDFFFNCIMIHLKAAKMKHIYKFQSIEVQKFFFPRDTFAGTLECRH